MNNYNVFFDITEGYYPEINPNSIKDKENKWQDTFPHKAFINLLSTTERMLSRAQKSYRKGIWIEGAYGTGKSRVVWALKEILDCSTKDFTNYFNEYDNLKNENDLKDKLLCAKKEKIITVSEYSSSHITSPKHLILAVYESITKALRKSKIEYIGERTLRGKIVEWLSDENRKNFFVSLLQKPEHRGLTGITGKSVEDIISQLSNNSQTGGTINSMVDSILTIAESEGINAFNLSVHDLNNWITDIIEQNNLKAIVFIWDEFSSYFKNNKNSLDTLQTLSELSNHAPFYLVIVTHMSDSLVSEGDQNFKSVTDRFEKIEITLPDNVAFDLIAHALKVKEASKSSWNTLSDDLNSYMPTSREVVSKNVKVDPSVLSKLLPIHPMAALLLKNISQQFASNQRSMFNFIKNESNDSQDFQWFIDNHSPENGDILAIDYLWDFFYEKGYDEYTSSVGRSNLDTIISGILGTYTINEANLNGEDEKKVLKTILMMQAISTKFRDAHKLFLPNVTNLDYAFEGTSLKSKRGVTIAQQLVERGILFDKPGEIQTFAAAAVSVDQEAINKLKEQLRKSTTTLSLLENNNFEETIKFTKGQELRFEVTITSIENFEQILRKILNENIKYKIRVVACFARNENEQSKFNNLIQSSIKHTQYNHIAIINATSSKMDLSEFDNWIDASANELYWRDKDKTLSDQMRERAKRIINNWKQKVLTDKFTYYPSEFNDVSSRTPIECPTNNNLMEAFTQNTIKIYPLSFDNANVAESNFQPNKLAIAAKFGLSETEIKGQPFKIDAYKQLLEGAWEKGDGKYWETNPSLPISKLKVIIDRYIEDEMNSNVQVSIGSIFDKLVENGFLDCNIYAVLTGFLLKEYTKSNYRYVIGDDSFDGGRITNEKMADFIGEYIKDSNKKSYKTVYIAMITKNQKEFLIFLQKTLNVEESLSVEKAVQQARKKVMELGYPLWCFNFVEQDSLSEYLNKLCNILNPNDASISSLADELGNMLSKSSETTNMIGKLLTKENGKKSIGNLIKEYEQGELYIICDKINVDKNTLIENVREKLTAGDGIWLWDEKTGDDILNNILLEYKFLSLSNEMFKGVDSINSCLKMWKERISFLKLPSIVLKELEPNLKQLFLIFDEVFVTDNIPSSKYVLLVDILSNKKQIIVETFENGLLLLKKEYNLLFKELQDDDIASIFSKLPVSSYSMERHEYVKELKNHVDSCKSERKNLELIKKWEKLTNSKNPKNWSNDNKIPIQILVPEMELEESLRLFEILNKAKPDKSEIEFAIIVLDRKPKFLENLKDKNILKSKFNENILGKYKKILDNTEEIIDFLEKNVTSDIYSWYNNKIVADTIENIAKQKYYEGDCEKAFEKIDSMSPEKTKEYLKELIRDNHVVGIEIISKGDD